jgi:phage-related protein
MVHRASCSGFVLESDGLARPALSSAPAVVAIVRAASLCLSKTAVCPATAHALSKLYVWAASGCRLQFYKLFVIDHGDMDILRVRGTSGRAPFTEWMKALPEQAQARIDTRLLEMEGMNSWPEKWVSSYKGYESLIELRILFNKVQYRPLGMYSKTARRTFVLLCGAIEKGNKIAKADLKTADRRRRELLKEPSRVRIYTY